jgi:hypothetical protein
MLDFRDQILVCLSVIPCQQSGTFMWHGQAVPKDIEDLAFAGRMVNVCPYYGSRQAIPQAEVCPTKLFLSRYLIRLTLQFKVSVITIQSSVAQNCQGCIGN